MAKIEKLHIENFKAVSSFVADFKGCSAIITAGNNKGKTSLLRGLIDRIRFVRPDIPVKQGQKEGMGEMLLDTGEKFVWEFDVEGYDKLTYVSDKGARKSVTTELGKRFFPPSFDIDKFLQSTPKEQRKQLQQIVGIDFTDVDTRYQAAYDDRTVKNFESEKFHVKLSSMLVAPKVDPVSLKELQETKEKIRTELNNLYLANQAHNHKLRNEWAIKSEQMRADVQAFNTTQATNLENYESALQWLNNLKALGYDGNEVSIFVDALKARVKGQTTFVAPPEPSYITEMPDDKALREIDAKILEASETNTRAKAYEDYIAYKNQVEAAKVEAENANLKVIEIENERKKMIAEAKFPKGISIDAEGILVDGLPLDRNQLSTSKLYMAALRIAAMRLGEVKTLYFDASFLDKNSLAEIEAWANENDLQLLIERPDYDGGEIKYELIENTSKA